ncbi:MAG: PAS domain-containing protein [Oscillospiraceae bacterium]|nr:PAS domain-containing protein [Oscillospiraceae bacterium]
MKRALIRAFVLTLVIGLAISGVVSTVVFDRKMTKEKEQALTGLAMTLAELYDPAADADDQADLFALHSGARVTILSADGTVIGDSQADWTTMENHGSREEIVAASKGEEAVAIRISATIGSKLMYAAIQTESGDYIRLAQTYGGLGANLLSILPGILLAAMLALLVSGILAGRIVSNITGPLAAMNDSMDGVKDGTAMLEADSYPYEELQDMAKKINIIAADVSASIHRLQAEKDRTDFLLDNMGEGVLLLDKNRRVLLINGSACAIFGCGKRQVQGGYLLEVTRLPAVLEAVEETRSQGHCQQTEIERAGRVYQVRCTPVREQPGWEQGLILTMTDVTEANRSAQMRQEFFSNASHELKTPITSIKGSAELLCSDLPMDEATRRELLDGIGRETDRMNTLIGDIIMLSRIESSQAEEELEDIDFSQIVSVCVSEAAPPGPTESGGNQHGYEACRSVRQPGLSLSACR